MESKYMTTETHYATGRRKTSSARIYLSSGKGNIKVNDRDLDVYFGRKVAQMLVMQPLEMTELTDKVDIISKLKVVAVLDKLEQSGMVYLELLFPMMKS